LQLLDETEQRYDQSSYSEVKLNDQNVSREINIDKKHNYENSLYNNFVKLDFTVIQHELSKTITHLPGRGEL